MDEKNRGGINIVTNMTKAWQAVDKASNNPLELIHKKNKAMYINQPVVVSKGFAVHKDKQDRYSLPLGKVKP